MCKMNGCCKDSHPLYAGYCEDCWVEGNTSYGTPSCIPPWQKVTLENQIDKHTSGQHERLEIDTLEED
jgi:hypothetical protein